eukprot:Blabericola_migrator_1__12151@NODE_751_length_6652_cov_51_714199_g539_i0_p1_GENE_NODE_751_length_6652_cov_51_714199_g539_i0NODE_751_length_6652_cov_51_714199_g539_i0_p1_ORF_typecomplete_len964_score131_12Extensin_2/PF04554_13/0_14_NODE_751_length_6652_cov_51_714199_g539_i018904781
MTPPPRQRHYMTPPPRQRHYMTPPPRQRHYMKQQSQESSYTEQPQNRSSIETLPTIAESGVVEEVKKYEGDAQTDSPGSALETTTGRSTRLGTDSAMGATSEGVAESHLVSGDASDQPCLIDLSFRQSAELAWALEDVVQQEIEQAARQTFPRTPLRLNINKTLHALIDASNKVARMSSHFGFESMTILHNVRASLIKTRGRLDCSPYVFATGFQRRDLNQAIWNLSRQWHHIRMGLLNVRGRLFPNCVILTKEELKALTDLEWTAQSFVASHCYGAILSDDGDDVIKDFFDYLISISEPIDLSTAKFCLLTLLYCKHEHNDSISTGGLKPWDKLINRLYQELFNKKVTEVSLLDLHEFKIFCSACYGADRIPQEGWQASLSEEGFWPRKNMSSLGVQLNTHGKALRLGLQRISDLPTGSIYARQISMMKKFYSRLQALTSANFSEFKAIFEQISDFAEACIAESKEGGFPTSRDELQVLEVTRVSLQWCRLVSAYLNEPPSALLKKAYDKTTTAWLFKNLWSRKQTSFLTNADRTCITKRIMSLLENDKLRNEILLCSKALIYDNVPYRLVEPVLRKAFPGQGETLSDDDKMINLLALQCRLSAANLGHGPNLVLKAVQKAFQKAVIEAHLIDLERAKLPVPARPPNANLEARFVSPSATGSAARLLSLDAVLEDALKEIQPDTLTVSKVARHVASHLLGEPWDAQWADYITQDVQWCSYTAQQLVSPELKGQLLTLTESVDVFCKASSRVSHESPSKSDAVPNLIRHFVNLATLKWVSDSMMANGPYGSQPPVVLNNTLGHCVAAWIPRWLALMHDRQALFPSNVTVQPELLEALRTNVLYRVDRIRKPSAESTADLTREELSRHLRYLLRGAGAGTLSYDDIKILARKTHKEPFASQPSTSIFLTFLLYVWHYGRFQDESNMIEDCIKSVLHEASNPEVDGMHIRTMQRSLEVLLSVWNA